MQIATFSMQHDGFVGTTFAPRETVQTHCHDLGQVVYLHLLHQLNSIIGSCINQEASDKSYDTVTSFVQGIHNVAIKQLGFVMN